MRCLLTLLMRGVFVQFSYAGSPDSLALKKDEVRNTHAKLPAYIGSLLLAVRSSSSCWYCLCCAVDCRRFFFSSATIRAMAPHKSGGVDDEWRTAWRDSSRALTCMRDTEQQHKRAALSARSTEHGANKTTHSSGDSNLEATLYSCLAVA